MKKGIFGKLMLALTAFAGVFVMASCQTTEHNAKIPVEQCSVNILERTTDGKKVANVTLGIDNPTVYNTKEVSLTYEVYSVNGDEKIGTFTEAIPLAVRHGASGYLNYTYVPKSEEAALVKSVKITKAEVTKYESLWDTYMAAFIVAIVIAGLSVIFFGAELFGRHFSKEELKQMFLEHIQSELLILGLVLIICLIPLIFASWVTTLILLGAFVASFLVNGLLTLLKMKLAD